MEAQVVKLIDTSGQNGLPAPEFWSKRQAEAPVGYTGVHGSSAGHPTAGAPGSDIRVRVAYSQEEPGTVQVIGEGPHTGQVWKVARDERINLKASGGSGGAGGRGEDGQAGGRGRDGRNATRYRNGENGQNGAPGGDGGYGSNGADGAAAGHVFVTVHEEDVDLLLPLGYDVSGGAGGASGQHGEPGDGGVGGRGGAGHVWTERHSNSVSAHSRPGGVNGLNGPPGKRANTYLTGGKSGPNGSVQIKVISGDLSEATYPGVYILQVSKFDIIDENEDGVNEPGEHLHIHNIRVRNTGGMPSPALRAIKILVQGTQFLEPITAEPLELPRSIQPGQEVDVPGVLRAFIRNEWAEKAAGEKLDYTESVSIVATFTDRLNRPIPNFCGATRTFIRYPLTLDPPTYLDCVAKGDVVRFKWVLHNDSNKAYGIESLLQRAAATKLSDPNRFFNLTYATEDKPEEASDEIPEIQPNSMITIDQDFTVNDSTMEFSEGFLTLELMLADPITGSMRSAQHHRMHMQISGVYTLSPNPSYLLVVNSKSPNHAIHQIITLVRQRLHTHLDIFNLSLTGSYESPVTKDNVLKSYEGKSVIIFGNTFPYFNTGNKDPWALLDPWHTGLLIKAGTSIFFAAVQNLAGLNEWTAKATFPAHDFAAGAHSVNDEDAKKVIDSLKKTDPKALTHDMVVHRFPVKQGLFGSLQSTVDSKARGAAKKLNKNIPLRRFIAVPDVAAVNTAEKRGGVIICEGVPKSSNMIASTATFLPNPDGSHVMAPYHVFFIVSCLAFRVKARMFWNMVGSASGAGVPCSKIYAGLPEFCNKSPEQAAVVDKAVLEALSLSLQFDLTSEIYQFTATKPRFPDPLSTSEKLSQLPHVSQFFSAVKKAGVTDMANAQLLISTLAAVHALSNPLSAWQSMKGIFACLGNRNGQLTPRLNQYIFESITASCAPTVAATVKDHVVQRSVRIKTAIKAKRGKKRFSEFGQGELASFAGMASIGALAVLDLAQAVPLSISLNSAALNTHVESYHFNRRNTADMEQSAKAMLVSMVNPSNEQQLS